MMFVFTLSDIIQVVVFGLTVLVLLVVTLKRAVQQALCKHEKFRENSACRAICSGCGKDLGHIQDSRKHPNRKEVG